MLQRLIFRCIRFSTRRLPWVGGRITLLMLTYARITTAMDAQEVALAARAEALLKTADQSLETHGGHRVQVYRLRPAGPVRGRALLIHGWTSQAAFMMGFGQALLDAGYAVTALDLPAHGKSPGRITNLRIMGEAAGGLLAQDKSFDAILTHSVGGPVLAAAARNPAAMAKLDGARMVLVSSPYALKDFTDGFLTWLRASDATRQSFDRQISAALHMPLVDVRFDTMLGDRARQVVCVHCHDDTYIPYDLNAAKFAANGVPVVPLNGLGHRKVLYDAAACELVTALVLGQESSLAD